MLLVGFSLLFNFDWLVVCVCVILTKNPPPIFFLGKKRYCWCFWDKRLLVVCCVSQWDNHTIVSVFYKLTLSLFGWLDCLRLPEMERESDQLSTHIQDLQKQLENVQSQQTEDSRNISRQQKTTERYLAKKQMLTGRRDECNRNIRDLGVLPEEAFEKYTNEKMDRVGYEDLLSLNAD